MKRSPKKIKNEKIDVFNIETKLEYKYGDMVWPDQYDEKVTQPEKLYFQMYREGKLKKYDGKCIALDSKGIVLAANNCTEMDYKIEENKIDDENLFIAEHHEEIKKISIGTINPYILRDVVKQNEYLKNQKKKKFKRPIIGIPLVVV